MKSHGYKKLLFSIGGIIVLLLLSSGTIAQSRKGAIPISTKSPKAKQLFLLAREADETGDPTMAEYYGKKAIEEDPGFIYAYLILASNSGSAKDYEDYVNKAASYKGNASQAEKLLLKIYQSYLDQNMEQRLKWGQELTTLLPKSPRALIVMSRIQTENNEIVKARHSLLKAISLDREFQLSYQELGFSYLNHYPRDFKKAIVNMKKVVNLNPEDSYSNICLGDAYRGNQNLEMAREQYLKALQKDPDNPLAYFKKAHTNLFLNNIPEAHQDYEKALSLVNDKQKTLYANFKAFAHMHEGHPELTYQELRRALKGIASLPLSDAQKLERRVITLDNLSFLCIHTNMMKEANECIQRYQEALEEKIESVNSEAYKKSLKAESKLYHGYLAAQKGDYESAHMYCEEVRNIYATLENENLMENYFSLKGFIYIKEANFERAAECYKDADQDDIFNKYHMAIAYENSGMKAKAHELYHEIAIYNFSTIKYAVLRNKVLKKLSPISSQR